jgi:amino acid adenylation domain-containing protein
MELEPFCPPLPRELEEDNPGATSARGPSSGRRTTAASHGIVPFALPDHVQPAGMRNQCSTIVKRVRIDSAIGSRSTNFARLLLETASLRATDAAIVERGKEWSYDWFAGRALAFADTLDGAGVRPGDRVAILLPRGADSAAAFFGTLVRGAAAVFVNDTLRPRQVEHIVAHSGAKVLLASDELLARLPRSLDIAVETLELGNVPAHGSFAPHSAIEQDLAQIIYTSGSTGLPKGVTLSHGNLWAGTAAVVAYVGVEAEDRIASLLPFSFDYGLNQLFCCVGTGATLVVERSPIPQRIIETVRRQEVTILPAVPPLWLQLLTVTSFTTDPCPALQKMTNTGGRLPVEAVRKLQRCQPQADLFLMYGLTEAFRSTYLPPDRAERKPDSIGQAIPGAEIVVVDDELNRCEPGAVGELIHRGPTVALGYWNDPDATSRVFRANPLRVEGAPDAERVVFSGDLAYMDAEGDLFFVGRRDMMIKSLGHRVSPDEVADVLYASGEVLEAMVTAEPDDLRGSSIVAQVVLTEGGDRDRLEAFCIAELPRYMQPSRIDVRPSLPRTTSGKFDIAAARDDRS